MILSKYEIKRTGKSDIISQVDSKSIQVCSISFTTAFVLSTWIFFRELNKLVVNLSLSYFPYFCRFPKKITGARKEDKYPFPWLIAWLLTHYTTTFFMQQMLERTYCSWHKGFREEEGINKNGIGVLLTLPLVIFLCIVIIIIFIVIKTSSHEHWQSVIYCSHTQRVIFT